MVKVTKYREKKQRDTKNNKQTAHLDRVIGVNQPFIFGHGFSWAPNFPVDMCSSDKKNTKKKNSPASFYLLLALFGHLGNLGSLGRKIFDHVLADVFTTFQTT